VPIPWLAVLRILLFLLIIIIEGFLRITRNTPVNPLNIQDSIQAILTSSLNTRASTLGIHLNIRGNI
jgi:hypothetical protein